MIQRSFNRRFTFAVCMLILSAYGCDRLKVQDTLSGHEYLLKNQHDADIYFPSDFEGKVMLVGYVYTHYPGNELDKDEVVKDIRRLLMEG